jgi:hypothetical protein
LRALLRLFRGPFGGLARRILAGQLARPLRRVALDAPPAFVRPPGDDEA